MNSTTFRRALTAAITLAALTMPLTASTSAAKPEGPGGPAVTHDLAEYGTCPLRRLDRQLVRCDNLTGAGVAAPLSVPELWS